MIATALIAALLAVEPHVPESGEKDGRLHLQLDADALYGIGGQSFLGAQLHLRGSYAVWAAGRRADRPGLGATGTIDVGVQMQYGNEPVWLAPWLHDMDITGATHRIQLVLTAGHTFHMGKRRRTQLGMRLYGGLNHWLSSYSLVYPNEDVSGSAKVARSGFVLGGQVEVGHRFSRHVGGNIVIGAPIPTPHSSSYVRGLVFAGLGLTFYVR